MSSSAQSGKVLAKILYVLLALIVLGGAGFGVFWVVTAFDRYQWDYEYGTGERHTEAVEWMSGHPGNINVQGLVGRRFMKAADIRELPCVGIGELECFDKVFTLKPPPAEYFGEHVVRFSLRCDYPRAR